MLRPSRSRGGLTLALVGYGAVLALVLLAPTSDVQSALVAHVDRLVVRVGVPADLATQARAEFVCNALILMPVSALGSLRWPRTTWRDWTAYAFLVAGVVELAQGLLLPERTATFADVAANTLGGLGGAAAVAFVRRWPSPRRSRR